MSTLLDRINRVIHTNAFGCALEHSGIDLIDFQLNWSKFETFDRLPLSYQEAIVAGEIELSAQPTEPSGGPKT